MARYRSEFLDHHWRGRVRPRVHYSLGRLPAWLRRASRVPRLANLVTHGPGISRAFAAVAGIAPDRTIPRLPPRTFVRSVDRARRPSTGTRGRVVLWPDTFTNHLSPEVGHAALAVLDAAGFEVAIPAGPVCCGLTWMTTGQLDAARRVGRRSLDAPELAGDDPVLVLEPSCAAALRTDLPDLLPDDPRAAALAGRVRTLAELLDGVDLPLRSDLPARAVVQPHCHQRAVLGTDADRRLLDRAGISVSEMVGGCCGLAGDFGATRGHERISRAVADLALVPALERADPTDLVLADGFSCRTQVAFVADRRAIHLAQALADRLQADGG
jgi:Fe-S oxidoreductase